MFKDGETTRRSVKGFFTEMGTLLASTRPNAVLYYFLLKRHVPEDLALIIFGS